MLRSIFIVGIYWFKPRLCERALISEIDLECGDNTKYRQLSNNYLKTDSLVFSNSCMMFYSFIRVMFN